MNLSNKVILTATALAVGLIVPIAAAAPPGLGNQDSWVDANGDEMFGNLNMGSNAIRMRGVDLTATSGGDLQWDGSAVCTAAAPCGSGVTQVNTGAGLAGGPITGTGTISVAPGGIDALMLAFDPATQAELDANVEDWTTLTNVPTGFADGTDDGATDWSNLLGIPAGFADGTDDGETYAAGNGLTLTGNTFSANTNVVQARVSGICSPGTAMTSVSISGGVSCVPVSGGSGTVTSVGTSGCLFGGPITTSGTLSILGNCIGTSLISDGTVGTTDLQDGGVRGVDIADNEVSTNDVLDNSLRAADILDEPGIKSSTLVPTSIGPGVTPIGSAFATFPSSGWVMLTIETSFNNPVGSPASQATLRVNDGANNFIWFADPGDSDGLQDASNTHVLVIGVPAGLRTFTLSGNVNAGSAQASPTITMAYFPSGLP